VELTAFPQTPWLYLSGSKGREKEEEGEEEGREEKREKERR